MNICNCYIREENLGYAPNLVPWPHLVPGAFDPIEAIVDLNSG